MGCLPLFTLHFMLQFQVLGTCLQRKQHLCAGRLLSDTLTVSPRSPQTNTFEVEP